MPSPTDFWEGRIQKRLNRQAAKTAKEAAKKSEYRNYSYKDSKLTYRSGLCIYTCVSVFALLGGFLGGLGDLAVQNAFCLHTLHIP